MTDKNQHSTVLEPYFNTVLQILFQKLEKAPADSFKIRFTRFYHLVSAKLEDGYGTDYFIRHAMALQSNVFVPLYLNIILPTTKLLVRPIDRKVAAVSMATTLCTSEAFASRYAKGWRWTCESMLELLSNAPSASAGVGDEVITEADVDDIGFGMGFTPLNTCRQTPRDDFPQIANVQQWVGQYIKAADSAKNGAIGRLVLERLDQDGQQAIRHFIV